MILRIYTLLKENRDKSTTIFVDNEQMEEQFWKIMNKEITLEQAGKNIGILNKETMKNKLIEFVQMSNNPEIIKLFSNYILKHNADYTNINFRLIAIDMIRLDYSQSEMARTLSLSPRVLSREFAKFEKDEDKAFYKFIKKYSDSKMRRESFSEQQREEMIDFLDKYSIEHQDLLQEALTSRTEEKIKKERYILEQENILKREGYTQKEIAKKLNVSESYIKRARKNEKYRQMVDNNSLSDLAEELDEK